MVLARGMRTSYVTYYRIINTRTCIISIIPGLGALALLCGGESGIPLQIKNRDALIVICTTAILASPPAERERCIAIDLDKLVIPLKYDNSPIPSALREVYEGFDDRNYMEIFRIVAENLPTNFRRHRDNQNRIRRVLASIQVLDEQAQPTPRVGEVGPT
jgi:uncharacterized protein (UPF0297 family)